MSTSDLLPGAETKRGWLKPRPAKPAGAGPDVLPGSRIGYITQSDVEAEVKGEKPAPRPAFAMTPAPPPIPGPVAAVIPDGNVPTCPPPAASAEALSLLVQARGAKVAGELVEGIRFLESAIVSECRHALAGEPAFHHAASIAEMVSHRRAYGARLAAVRGILGVDADPVEDAPCGRGCALLTMRPAESPTMTFEPSSIRIRLADATAQARSELAAVESELSRLASAAADDRGYYFGLRLPGSTVGSQDAALEGLTRLHRRRAELAVSVAALEADQSLMARAVGERVSAAVEMAGGVDAVTELLATRFTLSQADPAVQAHERELQQQQAELDRLKSFGLDKGDFGSVVKAKWEAAKRSVRDACQSSVSSARSRASAIVADAMMGDEQARASLESFAVTHGGPVGFAQALKDSRIERLILLDLVAAFSRSAPHA